MELQKQHFEDSPGTVEIWQFANQKKLQIRSPLEGAAATVGAQSFALGHALATSLGRLAAGSFVERRPRESCGCAGLSPKLRCARLGRSRALGLRKRSSRAELLCL